MKDFMKGERHLRLQSQTANLLADLSELADVFAILMTFGGHRTVAYYGFDLDAMREDRERRQKRNDLYRLQRQKYILYRKVGKKLEVAFTKQGAEEILRQKILRAYILPEDRDCVVVFDIPEEVAYIRRTMGRFLESAGFVRIQKSVWVSNVDCAELLVKLFRSAGLERSWVRIYEATEILH